MARAPSHVTKRETPGSARFQWTSLSLSASTPDACAPRSIFRRKPTRARTEKLKGYAQLLNDLRARIQAARAQAALAVNRELIALYWNIGRMIVECQRQHGWGDAVLDRLSRDLRRAFPDNTGSSRANPLQMGAFYLTDKDAGELVAQLARRIRRW
ncbi:MAG: DUF1016 N-terminal domain-containing protein [Blastocatellia bacterium]|nr:DUF1016 N-terminal domain-containing protein [Blastocatellia bacterium]MCX7753054.1 DUF1016 N-terminal domain-containing protein [Blastocatellia bacterium]MDW8168576.1 DUF1016 N-terminal domain-containing protein [Acidobacteriota bacterium]